MLYIYGPLLPVRILEEIIVWKTQEKEHTGVIKGIVPALEEPYLKLLEEWAVVFGAAEQTARRLLEVSLVPVPGGHSGLADDTGQLVHTACGQSREFIRQLYALRETSPAVKVQPLAGIVILHIIRESEYFLAVLGTLSAPGQITGMMREAAIDQPEQQDPVYWPETREVPGLEALGASLPELHEPGSVPVGGHTLPPLPYSYNALEPYIDEKTMIIHHDKHHQSYVDGLNKAELKLAEARKSGDFELVKHWERELAFNGAGHYLHTIF